MSGFENPPRPSKPTNEEPPELEDFSNNEELYRLLTRIPADIRKLHLQRIADLTDDEVRGYLYAFHERRNNALRESVVSDSGLKDYFETHQESIWNALENDVFTDTENLIGAGTTARVKRFDMSKLDDGSDDAPELAVKYLVTPTDKTLSVSGEHDLIAELEQMQRIEAAEIEAMGADSLVRVPHPYFYYSKGKIQCYGMELVDGINLERGMSGQYNPEIKEELHSSLKDIDREELMRQIDLFFDTIHTICLHGDVKPRNLMVSRDGHFYVIDFGQSVLSTNINDRQRDASEELKDAEKQHAKETITYFLDALLTEAA